MARYEHLPIYRQAFDLAVHIEKIVRHFDRYHKYTLGSELRAQSRAVLGQVIAANTADDKTPLLLTLRQELERFKVLVRLCHESGGFQNVKSYLFIAEQIVALAKQNEGWLRYATGSADSGNRPRRRSTAPKGETGQGAGAGKTLFNV